MRPERQNPGQQSPAKLSLSLMKVSVAVRACTVKTKGKIIIMIMKTTVTKCFTRKDK